MISVVVQIAFDMERNTASEPERDYSQLSGTELEQYHAHAKDNRPQWK